MPSIKTLHIKILAFVQQKIIPSFINSFVVKEIYGFSTLNSVDSTCGIMLITTHNLFWVTVRQGLSITVKNLTVSIVQA